MNTSVTRLARRKAAGLLFVGTVVCCGCYGLYYQPTKPVLVNFRIENHTSSFVEVTIAVSTEEPEGSSADSGSTASATDAQDDTEAGRALPEAESADTIPDSEALGEDVQADVESGRELPTLEAGDTAADGDDEPAVASDAAAEADLDEATDLAAEDTTSEFVTIGLRNPAAPKNIDAGRYGKPWILTAKTTISEQTIRVSPQSYTDGVLTGGDEISISATIAGNEATKILLEGDGTGTVGFDEGSVGLEGERLLFKCVHFNDGDTVVIRVTDDGTSTGPGLAGSGEIQVYGADETLPEPTFGSAPSTDPSGDFVQFRISNETDTFALMHIVVGSPTGQASGGDETVIIGDEETTIPAEESDGGFDVRVPPNDTTDGWFACGDAITISGSLSGSEETTILLEGDGTGTEGFDEGSVGLDGERLLFSYVHYNCGDTVFVRITDDDTSAGPGHTGHGEVEVYGADEALPESDTETTTGSLEFSIANQTNSFAQLHLVVGPPTGPVTVIASEEVEESDGGFDVRVQPNATATGVRSCDAQVILVGSFVRTAVDVQEADEFNRAVLYGDGTGVADFDENNVGAVAYQRLLLEGVHYDCGDLIQVSFTSDGGLEFVGQVLEEEGAEEGAEEGGEGEGGEEEEDSSAEFSDEDVELGEATVTVTHR